MNTPVRSAGSRFGGQYSARSLDVGRSSDKVLSRQTASGSRHAANSSTSTASPHVKLSNTGMDSARRNISHRLQSDQGNGGNTNLPIVTQMASSGLTPSGYPQHFTNSQFSVISKNNICKRMNDPSIKAEAIRTVIRFLMTKCFGRHVASQELQSPTKALYFSITEFLILQIDPTIQVKDEEDICRFYKDIGCPLSIPKSAVRAPGTPTTWPTLLAATAWICELLQYEEMVSQRNLNSSSGEIKTFDQSVLSSYRSLVEGSADEAAVTLVLERQCEEQYSLSAENYEELKKYLEKSKEAAEKHRGALNARDQKASSICKLTSDAEKLKELTDKCEQDITDITNSNKVKGITLREERQKLEELEKERLKLESTVASQEINKDEVYRIENQMEQKRSFFRALQDERDVSENDIMKLEKEIQGVRMKLLLQARGLNELITECRNMCIEAAPTFYHTTVKTLRGISLLDLSLDDTSLERCVSNESTAVRGPQEAETPTAAYGIIGNSLLAKSSPPDFGFQTATEKTPEDPSTTTATANDVDSLLGFRWKGFKDTLHSTIKAESANCGKLKDEIKEKRDAIEEIDKLIKERRAEIKSMSDQLTNIQKDFKILGRQHERQLCAYKQDVSNYQNDFEQLKDDLATDITDTKREKQDKLSQLAAQCRQIRKEMKASKSSIVQMVYAVTDFRSYCERRMKEIASESQRNCGQWEEKASVAYRLLRPELQHGIFSPPTEDSGAASTEGLRA